MRQDKTIYIHLHPYQNEARIKELATYDRWAARSISEMEQEIENIKQYRKGLYEHTQTLQNKESHLQLKLTRRKDYNGKVYYYINVDRVYPDNENMHQEVISEAFTGTERHNALKRFEALKKEYAGIEAIKNIDKGRWEK